MSIWCSWPHIGTDPTVMYGVGDGLFEVEIGGGARGRTPVAQRPERGNVLSYAEGFSNHYPDLTGSHERPAVIALAHLAPWCVPGHRECDDCFHSEEHEAGPWLRLEVAAPETLSFWTKAEDGGPEVTPEGATVLLDEEAARSLRDDLTTWLDRRKARPTAVEEVTP